MADFHTLQQINPPGGGMDTPVTWRDLITLQANVRSAYDPLVGVLQGARGDISSQDTDITALQAALALYQLLSGKDAASGYAGLDSGGLIKVAELLGLAPSFATLDVTGIAPATPVKGRLYENLICRAWVNFKDVSGTITVNKAVNCTVGFRTGTAAGDYTLTLTTACADAFWVAAGIGPNLGAGVNGIIEINHDNPSHTASVLNFVTNNPAVGAARPTECMLVVFGN